MDKKIIKVDLPEFGKFNLIENDLISDYIRRFGFWEQHISVFSNVFLSKQDTVLDAGANIGFHTVWFSKLSGKVYAFEPQQNIFDILNSNLNMNGCTNVTTFQSGLYNKRSEFNMSDIKYCTDKNGQTNFGGLGITFTEDSELIGEKIKCIDWDSNFPNVDITMIKMDIQGSEYPALKGMENMLKRCKPWILLELGDDEFGKEISDFLKSIGYEIFRPLEKIPFEDCICINKNNPAHFEIKKFISYITIFPVQFKMI